jgi:hypothetical protein
VGKTRTEGDLDAFIAHRASSSPYLRDVPGESVDYAIERWQEDPSIPQYLPDLARHELLSFEVGAAEDDLPGTSSDISIVSFVSGISEPTARTRSRTSRATLGNFARPSSKLR